jgi:hypothetical protein
MFVFQRRLALLILISCSWMATAYCDSISRPRMIGLPEGQEAAQQLMASLANACNSRDFLAFIDHFTPRQQAAIKRRMEDVFTTHDPEMTVDDVVLLADGEDKIVFGVRYGWGTKAGAKRMMASRVTAKKVGGRWKVDSETVKSQAPVSQSHYAEDAQPVRFEFGGGAAVNANWDAFNPPAHLIDPAIEHLRGDIGIQPGRGCVGGRCGLK